jgi:triosephosphate isomerase
MRTACVAGNWKMNNTLDQSKILVQKLLPGLDEIQNVNSIICPPFTALVPIKDLLANTSIHLGAQDIYWEEKGAYTGQISPGMVAELAEYVILGHSERRAYFNDTDDIVNRKILAALRVGLKPIFCVGETLHENEDGHTGQVVSRQIRNGLKDVDGDQMGEIMIAYEPIWAIGTGKAATPEGANQVIKEYIRGELAQTTSSSIAEQMPILYGGSVKPGNARDFFQQPDIDGALVGGASLKADDFIQITAAAA